MTDLTPNDLSHLSEAGYLPNAVAAAALRAAADQIEPDDGVSTEVRQVLNKLLAIADELENTNDTH